MGIFDYKLSRNLLIKVLVKAHMHTDTHTHTNTPKYTQSFKHGTYKNIFAYF